MAGPSAENLALTSPETDFLARVWTLLEADATFAAKTQTKVKWDGSPHDVDDPARSELPRVDIYPVGTTERWESNVIHQVLLDWAVRIRVRGWDKANAYGLMHVVRGLLVNRANFDTLHTGTSIIHEVQAGRPQLIGTAEDGYTTEVVMSVKTKIRVNL